MLIILTELQAGRGDAKSRFAKFGARNLYIGRNGARQKHAATRTCKGDIIKFSRTEDHDCCLTFWVIFVVSFFGRNDEDRWQPIAGLGGAQRGKR